MNERENFLKTNLFKEKAIKCSQCSKTISESDSDNCESCGKDFCSECLTYYGKDSEMVFCSKCGNR